jgi:hypothetical protein
MRVPPFELACDLGSAANEIPAAAVVIVVVRTPRAAQSIAFDRPHTAAFAARLLPPITQRPSFDDAALDRSAAATHIGATHAIAILHEPHVVPVALVLAADRPRIRNGRGKRKDKRQREHGAKHVDRTHDVDRRFVRSASDIRPGCPHTGQSRTFVTSAILAIVDDNERL